MKEPEYNDKGFLKYLTDLKPSLRNTYRVVKDSMNRCDADESAKYKGKKAEHQDTKLKKGIIEDLNLAINWIHTGRGPGKRGAERRGAYELDKYIDPTYIQMYANPVNSRSSSTLTADQRFQISDALSRLTKIERDCYVMAHGDCLSFTDIANHLGISKSSVQIHVERARKKVAADVNGMQGSLFLREFSWERGEPDE